MVNAKYVPFPDCDCAHSWVELYDDIWVCRLCNTLRWFPGEFTDANDYACIVQLASNDKAYSYFMSMAYPEVQECMEMMRRSVE